jgi:hypothetical protein
VFLYFDVQNDFITLLIDENAPWLLFIK